MYSSPFPFPHFILSPLSFILTIVSYQVIARKWRPQTFEEVTGQEHVTQTLRNALEYGRLHHAYLFSGARGVGKTTTARLLAKALNCRKTTDKPNLTPCRWGDPDACPSCVEISESRSMDVLEFDAASNTQVDKIREMVLENINIAPSRDRYKVFIIDEVHMLSTSSFNALLKTLEEPPSNVVFIMATTELHKVPDTIISRSQRFEFRTIPIQKIFERLRLIADAEKINVTDDALREIARSGEGSMRDAQSNFDQVISFSSEGIEVKDVTNALGMASTEMLKKVLSAVADKQPKAVLEVVEELISRGQDLRNFCRDLLALIRDLLVYKVSGGDASLIESSILNADEMKRFSEPFSEADLLRFFNSMAETESKLKEATQSRYVLEIGLVRIVEMRRVAPVEVLLERLAKLESALNGGVPNSSPEVKPAASSATAEKKTLIPEIAVIDSPAPQPAVAPRQAEPPPEPDFVPEEAPDSLHEGLETQTSTNLVERLIGDIDSMPIKLPPISAEDLEHVEDKWLDDAYEDKLERSGDDLMPITSAALFVKELFVASDKPANGNGGVSVPAVVPTIFTPPSFDEDDAPVELPALSDNPTEQELLAYAHAHPVVKKAMRVFRAKITEVKRV